MMTKIGLNPNVVMASVITTTERSDVFDLHMGQGACDGRRGQHAIVTLKIAEAAKLANMLMEAVQRLTERNTSGV